MPGLRDCFTKFTAFVFRADELSSAFSILRIYLPVSKNNYSFLASKLLNSYYVTVNGFLKKPMWRAL